MSLRRLEPALSSSVKRVMFRPSAGGGGGGGGTPSPDAPTNLAVTGDVGQAFFTWTAVTGATTYNLYKGTIPGGESSTPVSTGLTGTSYTLSTGLTEGTLYYFYLKAVNAGGTSSASNEVSVTMLLTTGLLALYYFDEGSGTTLTDHSGNARNGTLGVTAPTWTAGVMKGLTFGAAATVTIPAAAWATAGSMQLVTTTGGSGHRGIIGGSAAGLAALISPSDTPEIFDLGGGGQITVANQVVNLPANQLVSYVFDATTDHIYISATECTYAAQGGSSGAPRLLPVIGAPATFSYLGNIYFMAIYSSELSQGQVQSNRAAFQNILSSRTALPVQILMDGNSLIQGAANPVPADRFYNKVAALLEGGQTAVNLGIVGQTTTDMIPCTNVIPYYSVGIPRNACLVWEITNDLALASVSTATAFANVKAVCNTLRAQGFGPIIIMTCLPRPDMGTFTEANRQTVNASLLADFSVATSNALVWLPGGGITYADCLVDVGDDPSIGQVGQNIPPNYDVDGVHLAGPGNVFAAADFYAGLNAVGIF